MTGRSPVVKWRMMHTGATAEEAEDDVQQRQQHP